MRQLHEYVGIPWEAGAQGPDTFDCMGFFREVQKTHFGRDVPMVVAPDIDDPMALADLFINHPERRRWARIEKPEHGCLAVIRRPMHVGVWVNLDGGGILHCQRGAGVVFTHDASWHVSGFGRREFFRCAA